MTKPSLLLPFFITLVLPSALAQTSVAATSSPSPKYIFLVDISRSMAREKDALAERLAGLIRSGIDGRMQADESFGVWTFHEEVFTNRIPRQTWSREQAPVLAQYVAGFLNNQRFEKQTRLDRAVAGLTRVVENSEELIAFVLSDGDSSIRGTPFDPSINEIYQLYGREMRRIKQPFVTILAARQGRYVAWSVTRRGESLRFPELPEALPMVSRPETLPDLAATPRGDSGVPLPEAAPIGSESPKVSPINPPLANTQETFSDSASTNRFSAAVTEPGIVHEVPPLTFTFTFPAARSAEVIEPSTPVLSETPEMLAFESEPISQPRILPLQEEPTVPEILPLIVNEPKTDNARVENRISQPIAATAKSTPISTASPPPPSTVVSNSKPTLHTNGVVAAITPRSHSPAYLAAGIALFISAVVILVWSFGSGRHRGPSLISSSIDHDKSPK